MAPDQLPDPVSVTLQITGVLDSLGVRYVVAGSLASSLYGEPRSTNDVDIVADLGAEHVVQLARALTPDWIWSEEVARDAIAEGGSFNIIHAPTAFKVDVFVVGSDAFDAHRVASGKQVTLPGSAGEIGVDRPEHTVVRKLEWFRRGGEVSERQWRDVVGILRTQGSRIDNAELELWSARLGVSDLLQAARMDSSGTR